MNWSVAAEAATALAGAVAIVGAWVAYLTYRKSVKTRRAEWLVSLHERSFETDRYARVRRTLDYREEPAYGQLVQAVVSQSPSASVDEFYRYLNFFELPATLRTLGEISDDEIMGLFEYDLRMLTEHQFVLAALPAQGFERLPRLLQDTRLLPARA